MDTASTLIGIGLLLLFIGPVIALIFNQNKKKKKNLSTLTQVAEQNNLNIDITEISDSLVLGLDRNRHKLMIVEPKKNNQSCLIDLNQIASCEIKTVDFPEKPGKVNFISLQLTEKKEHRELQELVFYDEYDHETRDPEVQIQMARKWCSIVKMQISAA